ncbi:unnamed protein product [Parnassius mnemosyne]|uniref:Uncharacterized protein n=1 Tax=Parnassius mnemosyne TaxID=213953 RepID=A0AAV1K7P6_9NEOP
MVKCSVFTDTIRQFYRTTTLHGFKYLCSDFFIDRVCWMVCCCASACCAGVLCAVLWQRFAAVPALITLQELRTDQQLLDLSIIAACPSAGSIAQLFEQNLVTDAEIRRRLPSILSLVLRRKPLADSQVTLLDRALSVNNLTLTEALFRLVPACGTLIRTCRWLTVTLPCADIFKKEMTHWGVCCVMRPNQIQMANIVTSQLQRTRRLLIAMQLSNKTHLDGCKIFTKYPREELMEPTSLTPGYNYFGYLSFVSTLDNKVLKDRCIYSELYTKSNCMIQCVEKNCGCSDPLQLNDINNTSALPTCNVTNMNCLRTHKENLSCSCLPSCSKVTTDFSLEFSRINSIANSFESIYTGLNESLTIVFNLHIMTGYSKKFVVNPTEIWITLLSSLGGVFNMFLGVGLFSALEFLFLIFVKLPQAIRKSTEMAKPRDITRQNV